MVLYQFNEEQLQPSKTIKTDQYTILMIPSSAYESKRFTQHAEGPCPFRTLDDLVDMHIIK